MTTVHEGVLLATDHPITSQRVSYQEARKRASLRRGGGRGGGQRDSIVAGKKRVLLFRLRCRLGRRRCSRRILLSLSLSLSLSRRVAYVHPAGSRLHMR
ncbi:hypothetical protein LY76DRAFT_80270 [Colletotrichum caudatum]|nr:hypothetical protein LY76DRAFT_80270 [Colletotrichum caudatum]